MKQVGPRHTSTALKDSAYAILGVSSSATDAEIKKVPVFVGVSSMFFFFPQSIVFLVCVCVFFFSRSPASPHILKGSDVFDDMLGVSIATPVLKGLSPHCHAMPSG